MNCLACGHANREGAKFCDECGARLGAAACPECGQEVRPGARFCSECGADLTAPAAPTSTQPSSPVSFANGRYEVKRFLGEGGKKKVYLTHDTLLDRDVAFSLIKTDGLDETGVERIRREAQLMGRLGDHPYIVSLYDIGDEGGQPYLVSQLMGGGDVEGLIEDAPDHRPSLERTLQIADQICQALQYAEQHGIVHRDLKPGNVWLTSDGTAKLGDFGLAIALDRTRLSMAGMIVGTVGYMPPEQALGRQPDARSDLYSLGAMLYEMITGRPPFLGDDPVAIISQHINTAPVSPSWHNKSIPRQLETLTLRLLEKNPDKRPASAAVVREELAAIQMLIASQAVPTSTEQVEAQQANPLDRLAGGIFVGREAELDELRHGLDVALSGRAQVALLAGEPGIGKTRLAEELGTYARLRGAQVLWGRSYEWEGAPAYWPWVQMIRDYVHERDPQQLRSELGVGGPAIAQIVSEVHERLPGLPDAPPMDGEQARFRLFDSVASFLRNAAGRQPLVLVFDDLHWADEASLLLLQFVTRELQATRLLIVGAYRDVEVGRRHPLAGTLADLVRTQGLRRLILRGLHRDEIGRYLELTAGEEPEGRLVAAVADQTGGNPFFVTEVVRLLAAEGKLTWPAEGAWSVSLPQGVREVVGRRLDRLSEQCNEVLSVAAVIGRQFSLDVLARTTGLTPDELIEWLEEALEARVIRETATPDRYRFSQELIQDTLYEELSIAHRRRLNGQVGAALEELYANDLASHYAEMARHFALAGPGDEAEKAVDYAIKAGERAMAQFAWEAAIDHYERAAQILDLQADPEPVRFCELLMELGAAQNLVAAGRSRTGRGAHPGAGSSPEGRDTFWRAAELARQSGSSEQLARAALGVVGFNHYAQQAGVEGMRLLEEALDRLPDRASPLRVRLLARLGWDPYMLAEFARMPLTRDIEELARMRGDEAIAMARQLQNPLDLAYALMLRGLQHQLHTPEQRLEWSEEVISLAAAANDLKLRAWGLMGKEVALLQRGNMNAARASTDELANVVAQLRVPYFRWIAVVFQATYALQSGHFADAERRIREADAIQPGSNGAALQRFTLRREQGRLEEITSFINQSRTFSFFKDSPPFIAIHAIYLLETGQREAAREVYETFMSGGFNLYPLWGRPLTWLAEVCAHLGDAEHARPLYDRLLPDADLNVVSATSDRTGGSAAYYLGLLATTMGRWEDAKRHFTDALERNEQGGFRVYAAHTRYAWADMLVRRGDPGDQERALELLGQATDAAESMGMARLEKQAVALRVKVQGILKA